MPDENVTPTETVAKPASETPAQEEQFDKDRAMALIEKLRNEVKELKPKAKKAEDIEAAEVKQREASLSEMEKLQRRLNETEAKLKAKERAEAQRAVADKVGLPAAFAERLKGESLEELEADAKKLLDALPKQPKGLSPTNPGNAQVGETTEQKRSRIMGLQHFNAFDPEQGEKLGGGVFWRDSENK